MAEIINHPAHYQSAAGVEAIEVMERFALGPHLFVAMKHLLRGGKKGDLLTDLRKADWYIRRVNARTMFLQDDCVADLWVEPADVADAFDLEGPHHTVVKYILNAAVTRGAERCSCMRTAMFALREAIEQAEDNAKLVVGAAAS